MSAAAVLRTAERTSTSAPSAPRRVVNVRGTSLPLDLLVVKEDASRLPRGVVQTRDQVKRAQQDAGWAAKREHLFAAAAAGWHLSMFAINLAFWGFEGQAPDRYWPDNPRIRLQLRPGKYGNLEGTQRIGMRYLARLKASSSSSSHSGCRASPPAHDVHACPMHGAAWGMHACMHGVGVALFPSPISSL